MADTETGAVHLLPSRHAGDSAGENGKCTQCGYKPASTEDVFSSISLDSPEFDAF